jgi:GABA(A) receptor-associated protein
MSNSFQKEHSFTKRHSEAMRIRQKYPDRIPIYVTKNPSCKEIPEIKKKKYLVPLDLTIGQFIFVLRKRIELPPEKALFLFIKNVLPPTAALVSQVYEENANDDGFLYMVYSGENTFG